MPIQIRAVPTQAEERIWVEIVALAETKEAGRGAKVRNALSGFLEQACQAMDQMAAHATLYEEEVGAFNPFVPASRIWRKVLELAQDMAVNGEEEAKQSVTWDLGDLDDDSLLPLECVVFSQHYAEYWVKRTGTMAPQSGDDGAQKKRVATYEEVARAAYMRDCESRAALPPYSVGDRPLKVNDWTPRWENSATTAMVADCLKGMMATGVKLEEDTLEWDYPQWWWTKTLGTTWSDIGNSLKAAAADVGPCVYDRLGREVPVFHLQLVVRRKSKKREDQWMGGLRVSWDTTVVNAKNHHFHFVQVLHVMNRISSYYDLLIRTRKTPESWPTMPDYFHWAAWAFCDGNVPDNLTLEKIRPVPSEATEEELAAKMAGLEVDQTRATELLSMLEGRLEHLAIRILERDLASRVEAPTQWLANYVRTGESATLPIGGKATQPCRRLWARHLSFVTIDDDLESGLHRTLVASDIGAWNKFIDDVVNFVTQPNETWALLLENEERKGLVLKGVEKWPRMFPNLPSGVIPRIIQGIMDNA